MESIVYQQIQCQMCNSAFLFVVSYGKWFLSFTGKKNINCLTGFIYFYIIFYMEFVKLMFRF